MLLNISALGIEPKFDAAFTNVTVVAGQPVLLPCSIEDLGKYKASGETTVYAILACSLHLAFFRFTIQQHRGCDARGSDAILLTTGSRVGPDNN